MELLPAHVGEWAGGGDVDTPRGHIVRVVGRGRGSGGRRRWRRSGGWLGGEGGGVDEEDVRVGLTVIASQQDAARAWESREGECLDGGLRESRHRRR